ncbi:MAG TPA: ParB N-terminal domain-containing protein [Gemmatimonadales bacterium]|nr:ParB N-terminal domain-containing protein [Gemmatimonadales bacterium]
MPEPKTAVRKPVKRSTAKRRKLEAAPRSRGVLPDALGTGSPPAVVTRLAAAIEADGGSVLATYRDPLGGHWQLFAGLPIDLVEPTPYQRDLSEAHVARLCSAIDRLGRYLDPMVVVRTEDGKYWTPNGNHRLAALRTLGARAAVAIVVPEPEVARRILLLNTEKAHNLRERALEVARLARNLAELDDRPEREFEAEFEEPALITLGLCYLENGRFAGGAYHPILKRIDKFLGSALPKALEIRRERADRVLELDAAVSEAVTALKARGLDSPYLRAFVVARINPIRFKRGAKVEFDETIDKMLAGARRFDAGRIRQDQVARAGGGPEE